MKKLHRLLFITLTLIVTHVLAPVAAAHPLGNFTINHYAGLIVSREAVSIDYVLDMAEIPAFQEIATFDANHNGQPDADETARYHPAQCEAIRSQLVLRLADHPVNLTLVSSAVEFPPGAGGLLTLRLECGFRASIAAGESVRVEFQDNAYAVRQGWREIVVTGEGVALRGEFATTSLSRHLTAYPTDLLSSPLDQRAVTFEFAPVAAPGQPPAQTATRGEPANSLLPLDRNDAFTRLVTLQDLSLPTLAFALAVAVVWGAMHAMTPGHGKTLVGAYLVGTRGTAWHALFLGLTTTLTHTAGVFALGAVTLFASEFVVPERLYPWLSFLSGLLVVGLGLSLFVNRLRPLLGGVFVGKRPFATLIPEHRHPDHHVHAHEHNPPHDHDHDRQHALHDHVHARDHAEGHSHPGHSHLPPGADGSPVTWRSLLALGISGGLLPCPSALVVLLAAIALGRIGFGLVLVLAFSFGLAGTLTAIGLLLIYAGRLVERFAIRGRVMRLLPAASALFIAAAGMGITAQAFLQLGLFRP